MPKLRQNPITGEWVVIAPERAKRPEDFITAVSPNRPIDLAGCPFCPGGASPATKIKEISDRYFYVIPNKFPAFTEKESISVDEEGFFTTFAGGGGHEVIITYDHQLYLNHFTKTAWQHLFDVFLDRYHFYENQSSVEYIMPIYNHGAEAAASIDHPHAQLFASPVIPNYLIRELTGSRDYYQKNQECVFCRLVREERQGRARLIWENKDFVLMTFFASRFQFETWVVPKEHRPFFSTYRQCPETLAEAMRQAISRLDRGLRNPPLNFFLHSFPPRATEWQTESKVPFYHWHLEITPRLAKFGGYEMGSMTVIDVISPELAAEFLRKQG